MSAKRTTKEFDCSLDVIRAVIMPGQILQQREIADICGCSRSLIHQIEKKALRKIREHLRKELEMDHGEFSQAKVIDFLQHIFPMKGAKKGATYGARATLKATKASSAGLNSMAVNTHGPDTAHKPRPSSIAII